MTTTDKFKDRGSALAREWVRAIATSPVRGAMRRLSMARLLPRAVWARLPVKGNFRVSSSGAGFLYDGDADDSTARRLYWKGLDGVDQGTLSHFQAEVSQAALVVDVGANRGIYTLTALSCNPTSEVVSIEASPQTFRYLEQAIEMNGWVDRVTSINIAAGAEVGRMDFHVPNVWCAPSARLVAAPHRSATDGEIIDVVVVPLDDLVAHADVVKIDVEGAEHMVLTGMPNLLATSKPVIFLEVLPEGNCMECETILREAGYRFFHLTGDGPVLRDGLIPDPSRQFKNYLCRA